MQIVHKYALMQFYGGEDKIPPEAEKVIDAVQSNLKRLGSGSKLSTEGLAILLALFEGLEPQPTPSELKAQADEELNREQAEAAKRRNAVQAPAPPR